MTPSQPPRPEFAARDVAEIAIGACILAFPVAVTEEVWNLSAALSVLRVLLIALASVLFLGLLILLLHHPSGTRLDPKVFLQRVFSTYGLTLVISALLLIALDKFDLFGDPWLAVKRAILVAFPASFAATAVDTIRR